MLSSFSSFNSVIESGDLDLPQLCFKALEDIKEHSYKIAVLKSVLCYLGISLCYFLPYLVIFSLVSVRSPHIIPSTCFIPSPQSVVRRPHSVIHMQS